MKYEIEADDVIAAAAKLMKLFVADEGAGFGCFEAYALDGSARIKLEILSPDEQGRYLRRQERDRKWREKLAAEAAGTTTSKKTSRRQRK